MGFLRRLFGSKKSDHSSGKDKKKWFFGKTKDKSHGSRTKRSDLNNFDSSATFSDSLDANKHAIAVAAATAAVAEAALAAAHAAAEVVRLTSGPSGTRPPSTSTTQASTSQRRWVEEAAAVKIQSAFRSYISRRALRALKALVKLQALVRGHIVRKQTADMLRRMQTLVRLQARARANRAHMSDHHLYSSKSSMFYHPVPEDHERPLRAYSTNFDESSILKRCSSNANFREIGPQRAQFGSHLLDRWMEESVWNQPRDVSLRNMRADDEKSAKILEVDTWKPHFRSHRSSSSFHHASQYYLTSDYVGSEMAYDSPSKSSAKALNQSLSSLSSLKIQKGKEAVVSASSRTVENSPPALSASSSRHGSGGGRRGPFTPTRSEFSWGFLGYPSYMANTESSRAKVRSQSAPKQR
ncbi:hypothetical protein K1719_028317 [Acacia pycnantha]|nr:hypothetical protein K1719_028317 [Acacia pycnantha]